MGSREFSVQGETVRQLAQASLLACGYTPQVSNAARAVYGERAVQKDNYFSSSSKRRATIEWQSRGARNTVVYWSVVDSTRNDAKSDRLAEQQLGKKIQLEIEKWIREDTTRRRLPKDKLVGPGESFDGSFGATLLDYAGCAMEKEAADLVGGTLPIGRYAFGFNHSNPQGAQLSLTHFGKKRLTDWGTTGGKPGERMEYNGILVCAPQNSGKTTLLVRWASAAVHAAPGYSVFAIDVKGNLKGKLEKRGLVGDVYHFSTDPREHFADRINFLDGPTGLDAEESDRISQLATALLPSRGFVEKGGIDEYHYRNRVMWLGAFIHLLKLAQCYYPEWFVDDAGRERNVDLSDLYDLVSGENRVRFFISEMRKGEAALQARGVTLPACGVDHWATELSLLLSIGDGGQRPEKETFRQYTAAILSALEPFSRHGTLHSKIRSFGPGRLFDLEATLGGNRRPVTVILTAREQDLEKSATILSLTIKRLQWLLFDRMAQPDARAKPLLLLLDETHRIRDFNAPDYIAFAREAKATCVIVYQALGQIGDPARTTSLLENVGTQIYLGSLVGDTAKFFSGILPKRWRSTVSRQAMHGSGGESETTNFSHEQVDYLSTTDLYNLPGGQRPALVYINDQPRRKPILVDLYESEHD